MSILYIPFHNMYNAQLRQMADIWATRVSLDQRDKIPPTIVVSGGGSLANAQPNESIYVLAHGQGNPNYVFNIEQAQGAIGIDAGGLAQNLIDSGLPVGHRKLKLYICNLEGAMTPFADAVKQALRGSHPEIQVQYYVGKVSVPRQVPGTFLFHKQSIRVAIDMPGETGFTLVHPITTITPASEARETAA